MAEYNYLVSSGVVIADTADIIAEVEAEYQAIFGDDFIVDPESPEGQLIAAEVSSRVSVMRNNALLANQINPNLAGGTFLDAIWALTGGGRRSPTRSTVNATLSGVTGTIIPALSQVRTTLGATFRLVASVTIGVSGSVVGLFESADFGPIEAPTGSLTIIVTKVIGWETATNSAPAALGQVTEQDQTARNRRRQTLGRQGGGSAEAIISRVNSVDGVNSLKFLENIEDTTEIVQGISLIAHSVWLAVDGGLDNDIAEAIYASKGGGTGVNGAVEIEVTDQFSGQPLTIKFDRPTLVPMIIRVTLRASASITTDPAVVVPADIIEYASGLMEGEEGFIVSEDVSPFEIGAAVGRNNPELFITKVEVAAKADGAGSYSTDTFVIATDELATIDASDIQVVTT